MAELGRIGDNPNACRRCLGGGTTRYEGVTILCPACLGTGRRRPEHGDMVFGEHGVPVGTYEYDYDGSAYVEPYGSVPVPPTMSEVRTGNAERCDSP